MLNDGDTRVERVQQERGQQAKRIGFEIELANSVAVSEE